MSAPRRANSNCIFPRLSPLRLFLSRVMHVNANHVCLQKLNVTQRLSSENNMREPRRQKHLEADEVKHGLLCAAHHRQPGPASTLLSHQMLTSPYQHSWGEKLCINQLIFEVDSLDSRWFNCLQSASSPLRWKPEVKGSGGFFFFPLQMLKMQHRPCNKWIMRTSSDQHVEFNTYH